MSVITFRNYFRYQKSIIYIITNDFYCPELFKIIQDKLHLLPFWTGIMIKQGVAVLDYKKMLISQSRIRKLTRLDNNCVENRFGFIKRSILSGKDKGEMIPSLYSLIKVEFQNNIDTHYKIMFFGIFLLILGIFFKILRF